MVCAGARQCPVGSAWRFRGGGGAPHLGGTGRAGTVCSAAAAVGWVVLFGGEARFFGCFA